MAEAVGACALVVVAYLATRPRPGTLAPVKYPPSPHSIRRHDGTGRVWDDGAFVSPPPLPEPTPEPEHEPDPSPSTDDGDTASLRLDLMEARLLAWLDTEYVALCARMQIEPSAVTRPADVKPRKGKKHGTAQEARRLPVVGVDGGHHRGRRRVRGGVRVA